MTEPLRPAPGSSTPEETEALAAALRTESKDRHRFAALERFLDAYPKSRWAPALQYNLGRAAYENGYFQGALDHWKAAWEGSKGGEDPVSTTLANLALAEYAKMNARIGRMEVLEGLLAEAQKRTLTDNARTKIASASEGLWMMRNRPGESFRCGPHAVLNIARARNVDIAKKTEAFLAKNQSPVVGFAIPDVKRMSGDLGLNLQIAKRDLRARVIVPAIVHWKVGHFGALIREHNGKYLLKDPTFAEDLWITGDALDQEASGYFLVASGPLPSGWSSATVAETASIYGKGAVTVIPDARTTKADHMVGGSCQSSRTSLAMATYRFHTLAASVHIEDTPIGYHAAYGPDVRIEVGYNQREADQPDAIEYTNFGPQTVTNWTSHARNNDTSLYISQSGGGSASLQTITIPGVFPGDPMTGELLEQIPDGFKLTRPDGSVDYYEQSMAQPEMGEPDVFLSRRVTPDGQQATIEYDTTYPSRIHQIIDATGLPTVFHYDYSGEPYLVTSIDDPFGRTATFTYSYVAGKTRLQSTEDPYGIVSSFAYNEAGEITSMTTPYGTTTFNLSAPYVDLATGLFRFVEATDPLGETERVEFNVGAQTGVGPVLESPQPNASAVNFTTSYINYRNSFYWDRLATKLGRGDYTKARVYHWLHIDGSSVSGILESEKAPREGRIFYNYEDQPQPYTIGALAFPSNVARVVKDASGTNVTQSTKFTHNLNANVVDITDAAGRYTSFDYDTNLIDVLAVKQKSGASTTVTTASYTYGTGAPPHRPLTVTDAAGKTTSFTYSATSGQVLTVTNAKSEVTTLTYGTDSSSPSYGRLLTITGDVPGGNRTFTYDSAARVRTATDSEGYTLTYDYDSLDRLRTVKYPDGSTEQLEYEDHSLVATKDREGRWTRHMYNALMQRVLTQDPALKMTQFEWCRCGDLRRFVDANGNITEWQRDETSRVTKKINPDATFETFTYELSGRLSTEVDAMSRTATYSYTIDDRLLKKDYSDTATPDESYTYDAYFPRVTSRVDGSGTTTFAYQPYGTSTNGAGRVALVNGPLTNDTLKHTYDELGRLKKREVVDDATQTTASWSEEYTFDSRGHVTTVSNNLGNTAYAFIGDSNRPASVTLPNGMQTTYDYFGTAGDLLLKEIKNLSSGTTPAVISQFDYTYRPDRSIDTWTEDQGDGAKTWAFGYDASHQLIKAERRDATNALTDSLYYAYDNVGNRVQVGNGSTAPDNYAINGLNQLLSKRDFGATTFAGFTDEPATVKVNGNSARMSSTDGGPPYRFESIVNFDAGANTVVVEAKDGDNNTSTKTFTVTTTGTSQSYEYDLNGNLRYIKQPNGAVVREYQWDQQNRLVKELHGTHESAYEYDGASRRWRITEKENGVQTKQDTLVWCGGRICQKRSGSTVTRSYFGNGFQENGTTNYFTTRDHLGSVREVVGSDGTTVASRLSYDPWGKATETGSGALSDFTYTGHYYDRATGLNLAQYRGYDPGLGRWLSRDPIGLRGGANVYGYVFNNPVNGIDPLGLDTLDDLSEFQRLGGLDYLAGYGVGLLNTIPLYAGLPGGPSLGDAAKALGLGGKPRCSASGGNPSGQGEKDGAIAAVAAGAVAGLAEASPNLFKLLNCVGCRNAIVGVLKGLGVSGEVLEVRANGGPFNIVSDLYSAGTPISENGYHTAVQVGGTVFDNLNPGGVARATWEGALHSPFGHTITSTPF